jgi:hypothetical protein
MFILFEESHSSPCLSHKEDGKRDDYILAFSYMEGAWVARLWAG